MKILLIKPYWPYPFGKGEHTYNRIWPPLSLANCAAILEQDGHDVNILDAHAARIKSNQLKSRIKGYDKIFITSSSLDRWQCPNINLKPFVDTIQVLSDHMSEIYVMGHHGTVNPEQILNLKGVRAVIRAEPEYTVADICNGIGLKEIHGISFKENENIISNPNREDFDLKTLPLPAYHLLDHKKYIYEIMGKQFGLFELSRGCYFNCKYCSLIMYGAKVRNKSSEQIKNELQISIEKYGLKNGYFIDLLFLSNKQLVQELCDFLIEKDYDFKWCCQTRADYLNKPILEKMKKAGCELIHLGVDSGMQKYLDLTEKKMTLEKITEAVALCEQSGIKTLTFFLFGFKGETKDDREEIFEFAKTLNPNYISFHKAHSYESNDVIMQGCENNDEVDHFIKQVYLRYYCRLSNIKRFDFMTVLYSLRLFWSRLMTLS